MPLSPLLGVSCDLRGGIVRCFPTFGLQLTDGESSVWLARGCLGEESVRMDTKGRDIDILAPNRDQPATVSPRFPSDYRRGGGGATGTFRVPVWPAAGLYQAHFGQPDDQRERGSRCSR